MRKVKCEDLGLMDYQEAWDYQTRLFEETIALKMHNRKHPEDLKITENHLLLCEHPHVYTLGKSGAPEHLLMNESVLDQIDAKFYKINRGGDITYHGPGQLVVYPIFDLDYFFSDIHRYLRTLEEAVMLTLEEFGIKSGRVDGFTGVWLDGGTPYARKICAMGVKCSRWVTMHGIGFNINTDLTYFNHIVPCGIQDKSVTSLSKELDRKVDMEEVKGILKENLSVVFDYDYA